MSTVFAAIEALPPKEKIGTLSPKDARSKKLSNETHDEVIWEATSPAVHTSNKSSIPEVEEPLLQNSQTENLDFKQEQKIERDMRKYWIIEGKAYDFSKFVKYHPGGSAAISLGKGLDCTELFKTYHIMKDPPQSLLNKYLVQELKDVEFPKSKYSFEEDGFIMTTRRRVRAYFQENNLSTKGSLFWQVLTFICIPTIFALMFPAFVMGSYIAAFAHGFLKGFTAVGAGHCMSHFSLFSKVWLNTFMFRAFSPLVISTHQVWSTSHIVSHHINTLTTDDLQDNYPVKRVQPALPYMWFHRFQHFYIWIIYLVALPLWTTSDFVASIPTLFTGKHHMRYLSIPERLEVTGALALNIFLTVVLPFLFLPFFHALIVCLLSNVPASVMLAVQIAVNHEVPDTMSKVDPSNKKIDWGAHQVLTSHNFGVNSKIALHMSGGLNMQIEHHLFPSIHYVHYPALSKIVQDACKEFNLPYNQSAHIFEAVKKHYQVLEINSKA